MKNSPIDEEIVAALNFSNLVLLDQCFQKVNYPFHISKTQSTKKHKSSKSSKFQKVIKSKQKHIESSNKFEKITIPSSKKLSYDENEIISKVKICADDIDIFSQASFNNNANNFYTPVTKTDEYTINDFLNQTAISSSKNKFSPINAWKASSVEKYHPHNFQNLVNSQLNSQKQTYGVSFFDSSAKKSQKSTDNKQKEISSTKSVSKKGKKFEKYPSKKKTISNQPQQISKKQNDKQQKPFKIHKVQEKHQQFIPVKNYKTQTLQNKPFKQQQQVQQQSIISQKSSFYDNETRDTCELAPSKLQKLIEVEDNKYKEMVLKTFYKHQK